MIRQKLCNGLLLLSSCFLLNAQTPLFNVTDLGVALGTNSVAQAINNPGSVVGYWAKNDGYAAFLYQSNQVYEITSLGTNSNFALSINDAGHVVGHSLTDDGYRAFYFDGAGPLNLGAWGGTNSFGTGINISNIIVGFSESTNGSTAVLFDGQAWNIGNLGGTYTYPMGINVSNVVVGEATTTNGESHAFRYDGTVIADLNTVAQTTDFTLIAARAINNDGAIVGKGTTNGTEQAFLFTGTNLTAIPLLATATNGEAFAINGQNSVVGTGRTTGGGRAFLWKSGTIYDLNSCIDPSYNWTLREATGINDSGKIVGWADVQGETHAFLLTPNQPPSVAISSPANGSTNSAPLDLTISVSASDDVTVSKVEFYAGTQLLSTKTSAPYTITWPHVRVGDYSLKAVAYDNLNCASTSAPVTITVTLPRTVDIQSWLKADLLNLTNGAAVTTWTDSSGKNNSPTQSTSSKRPTFQTNQINGLPALRFDGTDDTLEYSKILATNDFTVFAVARPLTSHEIDAEGNVNGGSSNQRFLFSDAVVSTASNATAGLSLGNNGLTAYEYQWRSGGSYQPSHATFAGPVGNRACITTLRYQNLKPDIYLNGFLVRSGYPSERSTVYTAKRIGRDWTDGFYGNVAEVIIYKGALEDAEIASVAEYLDIKYHAYAEQPQVSLSADALSQTEVLLAWNQEVTSNILTCTIERKLSGGTFSPLTNVIMDTKFVDSGLSTNTAYTYRVRLGSSLSTNDWSNEVTAQTFASTASFPLTNVLVWLRAQDAIADTNFKVATWPDFRSTTNSARQTNTTLQPVLETSSSGQKQIRFMGGYYLELPRATTNATQAEIIAVVQSDTTVPATNQGLWKFGTGYSYYPATNGVVWDSFGSTTNHLTIAPLPSLTNSCIYSVGAKAGAWQSRLNGETKHQSTNNTFKFSGAPLLGVSSNGVTAPFNGNIKELLVFNKVLSRDEYATVRDALSKKYAIQLSQPVLPGTITVTNNSQWQNTVAWTALSGSQNGLESYFLIERKAVGNESYTPAAILPRTASSYVDTNVIPQLAYAYRLWAVNDVGQIISADLISTLDSDEDGLSDFLETLLGTNPLNADSDGDGLPDGWEVKYGLNPLSSTGIDGASGDFNGDGISNLQEYRNGTDPTCSQDSTTLKLYRPN